ncbi:hypothetical protein FIA58_020305 [Flavobacterium jejuense]|uniref:DUF4595 domain-containing protein n=1 Tax=Flavobacterium jejuense TaxID=1544455 RepID=A0ABX0IVX0_9FLAO|nr:hypothetical protein [Flavobacterium jejuense]NHN28027.1 hypothetical protein [Flavobacterium jejuense]
MKKILTTLSIIALVFTSCSKDDSPSEETSSSVLVKKMILTSTDEDDDSYYNSTYNFSYNGNKITTVTHDNGRDEYTYSNELLTKIETYDLTNVLVYEEIFTYNSTSQLVDYKFRDILDDFEDVNLYTYNSNGTITVKNFHRSIGSTTVPTITYDSVYYLTNGEISKIENSNGTYIGIHDGKNSPFKNVIGLNNAIILDAHMGDYEFYGASSNYVSLAVNTNIGLWGTYTYDSNNYPVTAEFVFKNSPTEATVNAQYFYN